MFCWFWVLVLVYRCGCFVFIRRTVYADWFLIVGFSWFAIIMVCELWVCLWLVGTLLGGGFDDICDCVCGFGYFGCFRCLFVL